MVVGTCNAFVMIWYVFVAVCVEFIIFATHLQRLFVEFAVVFSVRCIWYPFVRICGRFVAILNGFELFRDLQWICYSCCDGFAIVEAGY